MYNYISCVATYWYCDTKSATLQLSSCRKGEISVWDQGFTFRMPLFSGVIHNEGHEKLEAGERVFSRSYCLCCLYCSTYIYTHWHVTLSVLCLDDPWFSPLLVNLTWRYHRDVSWHRSDPVLVAWWESMDIKSSGCSVHWLIVWIQWPWIHTNPRMKTVDYLKVEIAWLLDGKPSHSFGV